MFLIEARLETAMWNEGFDKASTPWATAYTTDDAVANYFRQHARPAVPDPTSSFDQDYVMRVLPLASFFTPPAAVDFTKVTAADWDADDDYVLHDAQRYLGLLTGSTHAQIERVLTRLNEWDGI